MMCKNALANYATRLENNAHQCFKTFEFTKTFEFISKMAVQSLLFNIDTFFLGNKYSPYLKHKGVLISKRGYFFHRKEVLGSIFLLGKKYSGITFFRGVLIFCYTGRKGPVASCINTFFDGSDLQS